MVPLFLLVRGCATLGCGFGVYRGCITAGGFKKNGFVKPSTTPRGILKMSIFFIFFFMLVLCI
jgi:hypothetical protein